MKNCSCYALVESHADFISLNSILEDLTHINFVTSNPYLANHLTRNGFLVSSLEREGDSSLLSDMAISSGSFARSLFTDLGAFDEVASLSDLFKAYTYVFISLLTYRERLVKRFFESVSNNAEIFIPDVELKLVEPFDFSIGRYDNLYSYYFEKIGLKKQSLKIVKFSTESSLKNELFNQDLYKKRSLVISANIVKFIRAIDYGVSEISFSTFLKYSRCLDWRKKSKYSMLIWKRTDILQSDWLSFFFRGKIGTFSLKSFESGYTGQVDTVESPEQLHYESISESIHGVWSDIFGKSAEFSKELFLSRFLECLRISRLRARLLQEYIIEQLSFCVKGAVVISNMPSSSQELYTFRYMENEGVRFVGFEHGITQGMSPWARYFSEFQPANLLKTVVLFWKLSSVDLRGSEKAIIFSGAPSRIVSPRWPKMRQWFLRRYWRLPRQSVVMIAAMPDFNNRVVGPFCPSDFDRYHLLRNTIRWVLDKYMNSVIIIKEYPGYRFKDHDDFVDVLELSNKLFIADADLDVTRFVADILIVFSSQSTISCACGPATIRKLIYVEPSANPGDIVGRLLDDKILGAERIVEVNREYYNEGCAPNKAWSRQLLEYL